MQKWQEFQDLKIYFVELKIRSNFFKQGCLSLNCRLRLFLFQEIFMTVWFKFDRNAYFLNIYPLTPQKNHSQTNKRQTYYGVIWVLKKETSNCELLGFNQKDIWKNNNSRLKATMYQTPEHFAMIHNLLSYLSLKVCVISELGNSKSTDNKVS